MDRRALFLSLLMALGSPFAADSLTCISGLEVISSLSPARASDANPANEPTMTSKKTPGEKNRLTFSLSDNWRGVISPGNDLYPRYIADPIRPLMAVNRLNVTNSEIKDAGSTRYVLRLGGRWGFLRFHPEGEPNRGFQLDMEAAFLGQFDADHSLDNIGWDGLWGILLTWSDGKGLAAKLATQHDSSHVGDEYAERTGRTRIQYTRAEIVPGISMALLKNWRVYAEGGYAYDLRNRVLQRRLRVKGGLEFEDPTRFWNERLGYYAAIDVTAFEELDWQRDITIQAGLLLPIKSLARSVRFGVEYRDGRSVIGEFFQDKETYFALGFWADL